MMKIGAREQATKESEEKCEGGAEKQQRKEATEVGNRGG
jgi:hypothetical protein